VEFHAGDVATFAAHFQGLPGIGLWRVGGSSGDLSYGSSSHPSCQTRSNCLSEGASAAEATVGWKTRWRRWGTNRSTTRVSPSHVPVVCAGAREQLRLCRFCKRATVLYRSCFDTLFQRAKL